MRWIKPLVLAVPLAMAAMLNGLMLAADHLHWRGQHIAGYGFLFGSPWAPLLDALLYSRWTPTPHNRALQYLLGYGVILWIPAGLYSACLWFILRVIQSWLALRHSPPKKPPTP